MKKIKKARLLSFLLIFSMVLALMPMDASHAAGYTLTIVNGAKNPGGQTSLVIEQGGEIMVEAFTAEAGKVFDKWVTEDGVAINYPNDTSTFIQMPGNDATITATYKNAYVAVTGITGIPTTGVAGTEVDLSTATVTPSNASNKTITWSVDNPGTTGVQNSDLASSKFTAVMAGTLSLTATIANGLTESTAYTQNFTITIGDILDTTPPVITLLGNATVNLVNGATYTDAGATAQDNKDGNITTSIIKTITNNVDGGNTFDNTKAATYTYHYNVKDAANNAATTITRTVIVAATVVPDITPAVIKISAGADQTHQADTTGILTITCSGALETLEGIYVDDTLVAPSNYTLKSGSTILTLKAEYLNTLSVGTHTLKFAYSGNGFAQTTLVVAKKDAVPKTGDDSMPIVWLLVFVLSLASCGGILYFGKKKKIIK